jgi:uncharacterized membrane protein
MSLAGILIHFFVTGAVVWWAPSLFSQPGDPPAVREGVRKLFRDHRRHVLIALASALAVLLVWYRSFGRPHWMQILLAFLLICSALTLRLQWRLRGLRIAHASLREACLVVDEFEQLPRWPWFAAVVVLSLAAAYLAMMWSQIPSRFPVHWNFAGNANGWSERTFWGVFRPLLIGVAVVASMYGMQHFQRWFLRRQWSTLGEETRDRYLLGLRAVTYSSIWVTLGLAALAVWLPFAGQPDLRHTMTAVVAYMAGIVVIIMASRRINN